MKRTIVWVVATMAFAAAIGTALVAQDAGWPVPEEARARTNPVPSSPQAVAEGQDLYKASCQRCHGDTGTGDGPAAQLIRPAPADLSTADAQARMTDGEIFYKISEGKTPMPAMRATLSEADRWKIVLFVRTFQPAGVAAEAARADPTAPLDATRLVETWFERWNALDGTPETEQAFVDLYEADALHTTGPASHQLGTVIYRGHDAIRKLAADFVESFERQTFRIETVTEHEQSTRLFNTASGPWGGPSIAVQFVGAYTSRQDARRYVYPGAAFFQILDGKIHRLRVYMATGELAEVEPDLR